MKPQILEAYALRDNKYERVVILPDAPRRRDFLKVLFGHWVPTLRAYNYSDLSDDVARACNKSKPPSEGPALADLQKR